MLIFDSFPSMDRAKQFARHVAETFGHNAQVFDSQEESNKVDPFPFDLFPPIVLVERDDNTIIEQQMEASVPGFGGVCAGT